MSLAPIASVAIAMLFVGCDGVFGLSNVDVPPDAPSDANLCAIGPLDPRFHDEDGDGINDSCDDCPGISDPMQIDRDLDGVGDACDPHITTPGDFIASIELFNGQNYAWSPDLAGSWMLGGDALANIVDTARLTLSVTALQPTLELKFIANEFQASSSAQILLSFANGHNGMCRLFNPQLMSIQTKVDGSGVAGTVVNGTRLTIGVVNLLRYTLDATPTCTLDGLSASSQVVNGAGTLTVSIDLTTFKASFGYLIIYGVR